MWLLLLLPRQLVKQGCTCWRGGQAPACACRERDDQLRLLQSRLDLAHQQEQILAQQQAASQVRGRLPEQAACQAGLQVARWFARATQRVLADPCIRRALSQHPARS